MPLDPSLDPLFEGAGKQYNVDPNMLRAIALQESGGNVATPDSSAGAQGLMQMLPDTAKGLGVTDPRDPTQAIPGAAKLLSQRLSEAETLRANGQDVDPASYAVMAYFGGNPGPSWGPKTQQYGQDVAAKYRTLASTSEPTPAPTAATSPAATAQGDGLAQLRTAGGSAPILAPDQYAQSPTQFANQMVRSVGASGVAPAGSMPPTPATAQGDGLVRLASAGFSDVGPSSALPTNAPQSTPGPSEAPAGGPVSPPVQSPAPTPSGQPAASSAGEEAAEGGLDPRLRAFGYGNLNLLPEPAATAPATTPAARPAGQPAPTTAEGTQAAQILAGYKDQAGLWALAGDEGQRDYYQHLYDTGMSAGVVTGPQGQVLRVPGVFEAQGEQAGTKAGATEQATSPYDFVTVHLNGVPTEMTRAQAAAIANRQYGGPQAGGGAPGPAAAGPAPTVPSPAPTGGPGAPTPGPAAAGAAPTPLVAAPTGGPPAAAPLPGQPGSPMRIGGVDPEAAKRVATIADDATGAQAQLGTISEMRGLLNNGLQSGWGQPWREAMANRLTGMGVNQGLVDGLMKIDPGQAGAFDKLALQLVSQGVQNQAKTGGVFEAFHQVYPSLESNRDSLDLMTNSLGMLAQRQQDRRDFVQQAWANGGHSYDAELQAEQAFDQQHPQTNYIHAGEIMSPKFANDTWKGVTDPAQRAAIVATVPAGRTWYDEHGGGFMRGRRAAPAAGG